MKISVTFFLSIHLSLVSIFPQICCKTSNHFYRCVSDQLALDVDYESASYYCSTFLGGVVNERGIFVKFGQSTAQTNNSTDGYTSSTVGSTTDSFAVSLSSILSSASTNEQKKRHATTPKTFFQSIKLQFLDIFTSFFTT